MCARIAVSISLVLILVGLGLYRSGALQLRDPDPERFPVIGIDVSHHQGAIDWQQVAASGVAFAFIKASEGRDFRDRRFAENWEEARRAGVPRGAYHFFTFCSPGEAQARHFLDVVAPQDDALPPAADVEFVGNCTSFGDLAKVREELETFVSIVEQVWGRRPILYLTPDSLLRVIGDALPAYPVWIRSVFTESPLDTYRNWVIWQFSDNSRVPGIAGPVDRNALRPGITLESLRRPGGR